MPGARKPVYNISKITTEAGRIRDAFYGFVGTLIDQDVFQMLVDKVHVILPGIPKDLVFESLRDVLGTILTEEIVDRLSMRISGNLSRLKVGKPAWPWVAQREDEWMPFEVIAVRRHVMHRTFKGVEKIDHGYYLSCKILAGSACPMVINKFWSGEICNRVAKTIGFVKPARAGKIGQTRKFRGYVYKHPREMVGLRMMGLFTPDTCVNGLDFKQVGCTASQVDLNKVLIDRRRSQQRNCPAQYPIEHHCHQCPIGQDVCSLSTHKSTYEVGTCPSCNRPNAWFVAGIGTSLCTDCTNLSETDHNEQREPVRASASCSGVHEQGGTDTPQQANSAGREDQNTSS